MAIELKEPAHEFFGLSYAHYLVLPRSALQSMPVEWQEQFINMVNELNDKLGGFPETGEYEVQVKDQDGDYITDPAMDYERGRRRLPLRQQGAE